MIILNQNMKCFQNMKNFDFFCQDNFGFFRRCLRGDSKNYRIKKNSPEMDVSQRVHNVEKKPHQKNPNSR